MFGALRRLRIRPKAMLRRVAIACGALPVRTWEASLSKVVSRTFSGGQPADRVPRLGVFPLFVG